MVSQLPTYLDHLEEEEEPFSVALSGLYPVLVNYPSCFLHGRWKALQWPSSPSGGYACLGPEGIG